MTTVSPVRGVWAPILTPLDQDLNPDVARLAAFGRYLLDNGCHGLVIFGTTSEATSFSAQERIALVDGLLAAGLPADRLIIGTGTPAITETAALSTHAIAAHGATASSERPGPTTAPWSPQDRSPGRT